MESERVAWSNSIVMSCLKVLSSANSANVHCYLSFRSEVATGTLIEALLTNGARVSVPTVQKIDGVDELVQASFAIGDSLEIGPFGIPEPKKIRTSDTETLNAVVIPLAAFDRSGARIGYGKGFYDRFLQKVAPSAIRIGLAFGLQEVSLVPRESQDELLDVVVTELEVIECPERRSHLV